MIKYPQTLAGPEIAEYLISLDAKHAKLYHIHSLFGNQIAELKILDISYLKRFAWVRPDKEKCQVYAKLDPNTIPPLLVQDDGYIIDGSHRLQVAEKQRLKSLPCYVVSRIVEESLL